MTLVGSLLIAVLAIVVDTIKNYSDLAAVSDQLIFGAEYDLFSKGTLEWRCFESTLHAGKVRANITLALAISAQTINQRCAQMKKTEISENPCFTFRTFLLRLGLIGPEYKNVRDHLLSNLEGDRAWTAGRNLYAS